MSTDHRPAGHSRRRWLVAAPAGLFALGVAAHHWWSTRSPAAGLVGSEAFTSLTPGLELGRWTVVRVHPMHLGAVPVVLQTLEGRRYQVDVLARDPAGPQGVANTDRLSLFVVNSHTVDRADGERPTDEEQGLGAMMLARALTEESTPDGLLTHVERRQRHPRGAFGVPLV